MQSHVINLHHYLIRRTAAFLLHFTGDFVSAVSLWHKRAVKKKAICTRSVDSLRTFTRLRITTVLAHANDYL